MAAMISLRLFEGILFDECGEIFLNTLETGEDPSFGVCGKEKCSV